MTWRNDRSEDLDGRLPDEIECANVRVFLGEFPPLADLCAVPLCRASPSAALAWLIDGRLYVLELCTPCASLGRECIRGRPVNARTVSL